MHRVQVPGRVQKRDSGSPKPELPEGCKLAACCECRELNSQGEQCVLLTGKSSLQPQLGGF